MIENNRCPKCGCTDIGQGKQNGYAQMFPRDSILNMSGSNIISDICTECGYIIEMRVEKPNKFR